MCSDSATATGFCPGLGPFKVFPRRGAEYKAWLARHYSWGPPEGDRRVLLVDCTEYAKQPGLNYDGTEHFFQPAPTISYQGGAFRLRKAEWTGETGTVRFVAEYVQYTLAIAVAVLCNDGQKERSDV